MNSVNDTSKMALETDGHPKIGHKEELESGTDTIIVDLDVRSIIILVI